MRRQKGRSRMGDNQNWYRQLLALLLLSASKSAVEYLTNPGSREDATNQLREAFQQIDYDAAAKALTRAIDDAANTSKVRLDTAIDQLRDRGVDVVEVAKDRAEKQAGKKSGGRGRLLFGLIIGAVIAYFVFDEQRRDSLLDRLTGASGPIEQTVQTYAQPVTNQAQQTADQAATQTQDVAQQAEQVAKEAERKSEK
jgi:hypothetical protein